MGGLAATASNGSWARIEWGQPLQRVPWRATKNLNLWPRQSCQLLSATRAQPTAMWHCRQKGVPRADARLPRNTQLPLTPSPIPGNLLSFHIQKWCERKTATCQSGRVAYIPERHCEGNSSVLLEIKHTICASSTQQTVIDTTGHRSDSYHTCTVTLQATPAAALRPPSSSLRRRNSYTWYAITRL